MLERERALLFVVSPLKKEDFVIVEKKKKKVKKFIFVFFVFCFPMTAVSDGSPPPLRGLVDAALSAACDALAVAEEAEQVRERERKRDEEERETKEELRSLLG